MLFHQIYGARKRIIVSDKTIDLVTGKIINGNKFLW